MPDQESTAERIADALDHIDTDEIAEALHRIAEALEALVECTVSVGKDSRAIRTADIGG